MRFSIDETPNGNLAISVDPETQEEICFALSETDPYTVENDILETLCANSGLVPIDPCETGDLTAAPMLGYRNEDGRVLQRWAYMNYQVASFADDLALTGKTLFNGN